MLTEKLKDIVKLAADKISLAKNIVDLQQLRIEFFGKTSIITQAMRQLSNLVEEERKTFGMQIHATKQEISELIDKKSALLTVEAEQKIFSGQALDLTLPARPRRYGSIHPITQTVEELTYILTKYDFVVRHGPTIETDWYNFTALNIPEHHPARQMHDSFYLRDGKVLRTHTSPVQIRTMQQNSPPLRMIAAGRTYRSDSDMTHTPMFHQIEGLVIDKNVNIGHLKYIITELIHSFFNGMSIQMRFRPSFFPFTEPSMEVDISFKDGQWLEVMGCGMVHPQILQNATINLEEYQGFAFGLGVERFAMLKYNIQDLRQFFDGDLRWLKYYNFSAFENFNLI